MSLFSDLANRGDALAATKKKLERCARVEEIETIQRLRELI